MSFFSELKRRNVFRVGIAYAVTAWILLQVADLVLENLSAAPIVMKIFMLALAIGFPIALIFAWAFELTPEGLKLEKDVDRSQSITHVTAQRMNRNIIIALAIAVVLLLVDKFMPDERGSGSISPDVAQTVTSSEEGKLNLAPASEEDEKSIAVLPFVDMSPEGDQGYFADGISEEILNVLVKTHTLKVAGRTSSFQFRGRNEDLRTIGEQLGVANILEGSIRKANNRVRITAQLVKASDGFHLWSETYDRDLTDIFAIQDEIARAITDALAVQLDLADTGKSLVYASTRNMEAYDRYLEARGLIAQRRDFPRAIELLDQATQLDPDFAEGWAANAQAHSLSLYYMDIDRNKTKDEAKSLANKALEIDPNLSMAYSVLGDIYRDRNEWVKARQNYLRALALNPDEIEANEQYAQMLWRAGYNSEALKYSARAVELDPLSVVNLTVHAALRYISGDRAGGVADMERVLQNDTTLLDYPLRVAINMAINDGRLERAVELTRALSNTQWAKSGVPETKERFDQFIPLLNSKRDTLAFLEANMDQYAALGFTSTWQIDLFWSAYYGDYALAERIMDVGTRVDEKLELLDTTWFINYPIMSPIYNTGPYKRLVRRINLDDFWRVNGFPINCRPIGEDDFACN